MMDGRKKYIQHISGLHTQAGCIDAGMAAQQPTFCYRPVDEQLHMVVLVVHQAHYGDGSGRNIQMLFHVAWIGERQAGRADGMGQILRFKSFTLVYI